MSADSGIQLAGANKITTAAPVSLFIPAYNAARLLKRNNLGKSFDALKQIGANFEIIIVDDNSTDKSYRFGRIINKAKFPTGKEIRYLAYNNGPSRRENLARSFVQAKYDIIGFIDADFSCDISFFLKAVDLLMKEQADVVVGSRYIKGAQAKRQMVRKILSYIYNRVIRAAFKSRIKDHQCGLKVFRKETVMPILFSMGYDEKLIRGWFWDAELLIRVQRANLKIIEMPVIWQYADQSTFNFRRELRCLKAMWELKKELDGTSPTKHA